MAGAGFCLESNPTSPIKSGFLDYEEIKDGLHKFGLIIPDDQLGILLNAVGATGNDNGDALADDSSSVCVDVTQFEKLLAVIEEVKEEETGGTLQHSAARAKPRSLASCWYGHA